MGIESQIRKQIIFDVLLDLDMKGFNKVGQAVNNMRKQFMGQAETLHRNIAVQGQLKRFTIANATAQQRLARAFNKNSIAFQQGNNIARKVINNQRQMAISAKQMKRSLEERGLDRLRDSMDSFRGVMGASLDNLNAVNKSGRKFNTMMGRMANGIRFATHGLKGFRMEMLGVMFFGMMMQRMFLGLLRPVMEVFGVFDLFRIMLMVLLIPIMEELMPLFMEFFDFMVNLSPETKKLLGVMVILGLVFGTFLMIFGQLMLGIGSTIVAIPTLITVFSALGTAIAAIFTPLGAILLAIGLGIWFAWKENFGNMRDWVEVVIGGVKQYFQGLWKIIKGIFGMFSALVKGDTEAFKDAFKLVIDGVKDMFKGWVKVVVGFFVVLGLGVFRIITGIGKFIKDIFKEAWDYALNKGLDFAITIVKTLTKLGDVMGSFLIGMGKFAAAKEVFKQTAKFKNAVASIEAARVKPTTASLPQSSSGSQSADYFGSGFGGGQVINITNNIAVTDTDDVQRQIDETMRYTVAKLDAMEKL